MKTPKTLLEKRKYLSIEDAANRASVAVMDLIHLASNGELPIYALADTWPARAYIEGEDGEWCSASPNGQTISGPVRLYPADLQRYEGNCDATITRVMRRNGDGFEDADLASDWEYRLTGTPVSLAKCKLVIMMEDYAMMIAGGESDEKPLGVKERRSVLVIIAALAQQAQFDLQHATKFSEALEMVTDSLGHHVSAKTIENYFKQARELVGPFNQKPMG